MANHRSSRAPVISEALRAAFERGDFASLKRLSPDFVAPPRGPGAPPPPLFSANVNERVAAWMGVVAIAAAWAFALHTH